MTRVSKVCFAANSALRAQTVEIAAAALAEDV